MYRLSCIDHCLAKGNDYTSCYAWCGGVAKAPSYSYLMLTAYTASMTPYGISHPTPYSLQPYSYPVSPYYPVNPISNLTMQYPLLCPQGQTPVKVCDGPFSCYWECQPIYQ